MNSVEVLPLQHILGSICYSVFWIIAILTGVGEYFIVVLICISLKASDAEHFFMYLLTFLFVLLRTFEVCCPFLSWIGFCCCLVY